MIQITDKTKCCGCTSCANSCLKDAIRMLSDDEGFLYPVVDNNLCVSCGICNCVYPIENKPENSEFVLESYVLRTRDSDILLNSSSGGFITPLAEYILNHHGVICAAFFDKEFKVNILSLKILRRGGQPLSHQRFQVCSKLLR